MRTLLATLAAGAAGDAASLLQESGVQLRPSVDRPFFFFHIPKTGGTSVEDLIVKSLLGTNISSVITGRAGMPWWWRGGKDRWERKGNLSRNAAEFAHAAWRREHTGECPFLLDSDSHSYNPILCEYPTKACASVFAGHFTPSIMELLAQNRAALCPTYSYRPPAKPDLHQSSATCLTFLRDPVDASMSWYAFNVRRRRIPDEGAFLNMSYAEQASVLQRYDLQGRMVSFLTTPPSLDAAKAVLLRCTVGILERLADTWRIVQADLPWVKVGSLSHLQAAPTHASANFLRPDQRAALRRLLPLDDALYQFGLQLMDERLRNMSGRFQMD